jgi:cold shock CspA family protein
MNEANGIRQRGKISKWYPDRGYGFVKQRQGEKDIFVHAIQCPDKQNLSEGTEIEFTLMSTLKGPAAHDVTKVKGDGPVRFGQGGHYEP